MILQTTLSRIPAIKHCIVQISRQALEIGHWETELEHQLSMADAETLIDLIYLEGNSGTPVDEGSLGANWGKSAGSSAGNVKEGSGQVAGKEENIGEGWNGKADGSGMGSGEDAGGSGLGNGRVSDAGSGVSGRSAGSADSGGESGVGVKANREIGSKLGNPSSSTSRSKVRIQGGNKSLHAPI